jgi:hypothetical protein
MSREIRFRAYDKRFKCMEYGLADLLLRINSTDFSEPMQLVGKEDINNREIYEGDILMVRNLHDGHDKYWNQPKGPAIPFVVRWDSEYLRYECPLDTYNFEVVGNIYEDADLLI